MKKGGCRPDVSGALIGDVFAIFPPVFTGALVKKAISLGPEFSPAGEIPPELRQPERNQSLQHCGGSGALDCGDGETLLRGPEPVRQIRLRAEFRVS